MADVLQDFLVRLGFRVEEAQLRRFSNSIDGVTGFVLKLEVALAAAAAAAGTAAIAVAGAAEKMYYASQRANASIDNMKSLGYAVSQLGGNYDGALKSVEAFSRNMRNNPGYGALVRSLGVATSQNGKLRDTVDILTDLGETFRKQPYYIARQYAEKLGIDDATFKILRDQPDALRKYRDEYDRLSQSFGVNNDRMSESGVRLSQTWRTTTTIFDLLGQRLGAVFMPIVERVLTWFNSWVEEHADGINDFFDALGRGIDVIARGFIAAYEAAEPFLTYLRDAIVNLSKNEAFINTLDKIITAFDRLVKILIEFVKWLGKIDQMTSSDSTLYNWFKKALGWVDQGSGSSNLPSDLGGSAAGGGVEKPGIIRRGLNKIKDFVGGSKPGSNGGGDPGPIPRGRTALGRADRRANIDAVRDELRKAGLPDEGIAAVLGSMDTESSFNPRARNEIAGGHTGLIQWDKTRWPKIAKWIKDQGGDPFDARWQARAFVAEGRAKPGDFLYDHPRTQRGFKALENSKGNLRGAVHGIYDIERFGAGEEGGRARKAETYLPYVQGKDGGSTTPAPQTPRPGSTAVPVPAPRAPAAVPPAFTRMPVLGPQAALGGDVTNDNSRSITVTNKTDINVMGSSDPTATGNAVARAQDRVGANTLRNAQGAIR